ncbi:hypothetical protein [Flavobacterium sp.]|uniref:hypothetical protein n=1 Tax=Flavobacterium sp. TaxID=239 RepID=UPI0037C0A33F
MIQLINLKFSSILKFIFIPLLYELVVGGSGHYLEIGSLTFRMFLYVLAIFLGVFYFGIKKVLRKDLVIILLSFTVLSLLSIGVGYANNANAIDILEDIKPLIFFYILIFFFSVITNIDDIMQISKIIKNGALFLALSYFSVLTLLFFGIIDFVTFYNKQNAIGEIIFRNDLFFFYKGFLYLCVGYFFFLLSKGSLNQFLALLMLLSVLLTLTRGFILFTLLIALFYYVFINKSIIVKLIFLGSTFISSIIVVPIIIETLGDKSNSDMIRFITFFEVIDRVNPLTFIIGNGFGIGVPSRPIHMEVSFLEIFHKQGFIGVSFWLCLFIYIFNLYFKINNKDYKRIALPFLLSVIFIILQSFTNPYMNNPIGLTMILISLVVFSRLIEFQKNIIK